MVKKNEAPCTASLKYLNSKYEYRGHNVEWVNSYPTNWNLIPLKFAVQFIGGGTPSKGNMEYWNGKIPWVSPKDMKSEVLIDSEDHITEKGIEKSSTRLIPSGAVLIVVRSGILRHSIPVAINSRPIALNQDMKALIPKKSLEATYLKYFIYGHQNTLLLKWRKEGATVESIEYELMANTIFPIPPIDEQRAIAAFLYRETEKIDALIDKKERLIELLQEKRAALISHAVTKGLDPIVPMKDSGVEWLGEIPEHWEIGRNGFLFRERDERDFPELPILNVSIHTGVTLREFSQEKIEQRAEDPSTYKLARKGDLAFNKMRFWQGAVGVAPLDGLVSPDYTVAKPQDGVNTFYFENLFKMPIYKIYINKNSHGIVPDRNRLYWDQFKQMVAVFPPPEEQILIAGYIRQLGDKSDRLIAKISTSIEKLKEYRTALISAAVTGKIDVRDRVCLGGIA